MPVTLPTPEASSNVHFYVIIIRVSAYTFRFSAWTIEQAVGICYGTGMYRMPIMIFFRPFSQSIISYINGCL
jgi:hypothetical protein